MILYTKSVQAHWTETTVGEHGELVLEGVPWTPTFGSGEFLDRIGCNRGTAKYSKLALTAARRLSQSVMPGWR